MFNIRLTLFTIILSTNKISIFKNISRFIQINLDKLKRVL